MGVVLTPQTLMAQHEPIVPIPPSTNIDHKRISLGERLFSDVRLSRSRNCSCASCHPLTRGGVDGLPVAKSPAGGPNLRNTLTVFNVGLSSTYNWDGIASSLEQHTNLILANPQVMNLGWPELLVRIGGDPAYLSAFRSIYRQGLTRAAVLDAIASFERSLLTPNSRFDRYLRGERDALTAQEKEGYRLFKAYGCASCHQGVNIGGNLFQKFGVFESAIPPQESLDLGRFRVTKMARDREVFRVPSLRNVAVTGPYFHDGRERELKGAVATMAKAQLGRNLEEGEIGQIVHYLKTLTGEYRGKALTEPSAAIE
jgi:cytochrome c peroxidase